MSGVWKTVTRGANPFLGVVLIGLVAFALGAYFAPSRAPGYALHAEGIYRLEVGLALFVTVYVLGLAVQLAHQGRSIGAMDIGGFGSADLPNPDPGLSEAKDGFSEFKELAQTRLDKHDDSLVDLDARLERLEDG